MSQTTTIPSTTLTHQHAILKAQTSAPLLADFNYYLPPPDGPGAPSPNDLALILGTKDQDTRRLPVHDVRTLAPNSFNLKENGFTYTTFRPRTTTLLSTPSPLLTDPLITSTYYPELETLLHSTLHPARITAIHHLGHIIRSAPRRTDFSATAPQPTDPAWNKPDRGAAPAPRVHVDFTRRGVHLVLCQAFGDDVARDITEGGRRYAAYSVWRPLKTVRRDPLGICDAASVRRGELVKLERRYPDGRAGENVLVRATADPTEGEGEGEGGGKGDGKGEDACQHRWYWMSGQTPEEVLVIKIFDSADEDWEAGDTVRVGPHCSFHLDGTEGEEVRESIEVRVVVCF